MNHFLLNSAQLLLKGSDRNLGGGTVASLVITGMVVVFIGLILLILCVMIYGKIFQSINNKNEKKAQDAKAEKATESVKTIVKTTPAVSVEDGIDEEVVAVISAAVVAMGAKSGKKMLVKSVRNAKPSRPAWANAGIADNTRPF